MQNMKYYYDFSGQKFGHPLSLSINGFARQVFSQQSSLEISYVLQGEYDVITSGFNRTIGEHELVIIAPNDIHMIAQNNSENGVILTVHIDLERIPETMIGNVHNRFLSMICTGNENNTLRRRIQKMLGQLICLLQQEGSLFELNAVMMQLAHVASSQVPHSMNRLTVHSTSHQSYMQAITFINQHYHEDIQLADVAKQLSFSVSYTSKIFKKYVGVPFVKYLAYVRVRASLEALLEGRDNIEKIALDCGMPNSKSYAVAFKEMYGVLPSAYRKQFLKNLRYTENKIQQKMVMDKNAIALLHHLVELANNCIYEDASISICCREGEIICRLPSESDCSVSYIDGEMQVRLRGNS